MNRIGCIWVVALSFSISAVQTAAQTAAPAVQAKTASCQPTYKGSLIVRLNPNGRTITLTEPFNFIDADCQVWQVPKNVEVDGASIPGILWSIVGGPFEGRYRDASVIHDWYCIIRTEPWKAVHRMFYDAMITSGVEQGIAKILYAGVYLGGPKWDEMTVRNARRLITAEQKIETSEVLTILQKISPVIRANDFAVAEAQLGLAKSKSKTEADQYNVSSAYLTLATAKGDPAGQIEAIEDIISSNIVVEDQQSELLSRKAYIELVMGKYESSASSARKSLTLSPSNEQAKQLLTILEKAKIDGDEPPHKDIDPKTFNKLVTFVKAQDPSLEQIDDLVERLRKLEQD